MKMQSHTQPTSRWLSHGLIGVVALSVGAAAFARDDTAFPVEPGWSVVDGEGVSRIDGPRYGADAWFSYRYNFRQKSMRLTARRTGKVLNLSLVVRPNGLIEDTEGGRSVIQSNGEALRVCAVDLPLTCWPLLGASALSPEAERLDKTVEENTRIALETCGAGNVQEVRVSGFSCKTQRP